MSLKILKATKALLVVVPLAIGIMAFQNCSPTSFQSVVASSKGEGALLDDTDGAGIAIPNMNEPADPSVPTAVANFPVEPATPKDPTLPNPANPPIKLPVVVAPSPDDMHADDAQTGGERVKTPALLPPTSGSNLSANCKALREKFAGDHTLPATLTDIKTWGQSEIDPTYVHSVSSALSVGGSVMYLVGDNAEALAGTVSVKGNGHIVLCGLNAQIASTVGVSILDLVGGNIIEGSNASGNSKINFYTLSGEPK